MFNLGFSEMVLLGVIALIFIGPKELPELARVVGRFLNDLKRASGDLTDFVTKEMPSKTDLHQFLDSSDKMAEENSEPPTEDPHVSSSEDHDDHHLYYEGDVDETAENNSSEPTSNEMKKDTKS